MTSMVDGKDGAETAPIDNRRVCFVVMGFGKKTDFESGRTLDLDATYDAIVKPAAAAHGLRCIRADEVMHSGVIDTPMYEMLLRADIVIADISTGNVNAVYELGVRHALRPNSTIIMKERDGRLSFDLNHVATFHYEHLGADIGAREAARASQALGTLITASLDATIPDSPVYTYLPKLQRPRLSDDEYADLLREAETTQQELVAHIRAGEQAGRAGRHADAASSFKAALKMKPGDAYLTQQLALQTYRSKAPSELEALMQGREIIEALSPDQSNDPETLGIAGAIRKRLWVHSRDRVQLDAAIRYYGRGFEVRRDYYNGENLATCYDLRAQEQSDPAERQYDQMTARKIRESIMDLLTTLCASESFGERADRRWVFATMANAAFALGRQRDGDRYEQLFHSENPASGEIDSYVAGKATAQAVMRAAQTAPV